MPSRAEHDNSESADFKFGKDGSLLEKSKAGGNWYLAESAKKMETGAGGLVSDHGGGMGSTTAEPSSPDHTAPKPAPELVSEHGSGMGSAEPRDVQLTAAVHQEAPAYKGGAAVESVKHLANGATLTTTATGAEIEQMPGHSAYQVKAASPSESTQEDVIKPTVTLPTKTASDSPAPPFGGLDAAGPLHHGANL